MRIVIACIGRLKKGPQSELIQDYQKRSPLPIDIREGEARGRFANSNEQKLKEADILRAAIADCDHLIALDERGKAESSVDFARYLEHRRDGGDRAIAFIIGGADGLDETFRAECHRMMSFGPATWPHMLVRVMICEQVYRAQTILSGHPYHRV